MCHQNIYPAYDSDDDNDPQGIRLSYGWKGDVDATGRPAKSLVVTDVNVIDTKRGMQRN